VLGYLTQLGGTLQLDAASARDAIDRTIAQPLGVTIEQAADDILRVANAQMADLVRRSTVQRGHNPADFALYAYGGAAPQYAGRYAADLGVGEVVIPSLASVFSAYGAAATDLRNMAELEIRPEAIEAALEWLPAELDRLEATARAAVDADAPDATRVERRISLRFARQVHSLSIVIGDSFDATTLSATFRAEYERLVGAGTAFASAGIEAVGITVEARAPVITDAAIAGTQHRAGASLEPIGTVYDGATVPAGARIAGPAFVELPTTTLVVYPGHVAVQESTGDIRLLLPSPSPNAASLNAPSLNVRD
jgi:N-methylhydantoinase A